MTHPHNRRTFLQLSGTTAATAALTGACGAVTRATAERDVSRGKVKIGLLMFQDGVYKLLGDDQRKGWDLYLKLNRGRLGGREVETVELEEALDAEVSVDSIQKLIGQDVTAIVGVTFSSNLIPIMPICQEAQVPLISTYASTLQAQSREYIWRICALSGYDAYAIAEYVSEKHKGQGVYILASDYAAGWDEAVGFKKRFTGEIVGEEYIPFPDTTNFRPWLNRVKQSGARALFGYLPADLAVRFVKQFDELGLHERVSFYGAEGMTELPFLKQEGDAARNMMDAFYYSEVLDNAANREFVSEYHMAYRERPWVLPLVAYDAAAALDVAIGAVDGDVTPQRLEQEMGNIGLLNTPRGTWQFGNNRAPVQQYYLRQVRPDGDVLANVVLEELGTFGDLPLEPATEPEKKRG